MTYNEAYLKKHKSIIDYITADHIPSISAKNHDCFANEIATDPSTVETTAGLPLAETVKLRGLLKRRTSYIEITADQSLVKILKKRVRFSDDIVAYESLVK